MQRKLSLALVIFFLFLSFSLYAQPGIQWAASPAYTGAANAVTSGIATDASGNVYATGYFAGTEILIADPV